jgi:penicillin-binding protein 1A
MTGTSADSSFLDKTMAFLSGVAASFGRFLFGPIFRWMLVGVGALGIIFTFAMSAYVYSLSRDLPSVQVLAEYKPPVTTRVHAGDGRLIAEFASEHRIYVPYEGMPEHLIQAFVSAEDKSFFTHDGIDYSGLMRAGVRNVLNKLRGRGGNLQGGSTITQQVAKNMLLNDGSQEIERKIREAILAKRMEKVFSKEEIIELYMNEIYLGGSSYGVASAALNYFNKSLPDLSLEEAAVLAAMAQRPGDVNPFRKPERSKVRRDWVIERMRVNGFISRSVEKDAQSMPLLTRERLKGEEYAAATYFVEELRRDLAAQLGEEELKADGLSIRSTLDTRLQLAAQNALREGLENYDRRKGYRGPITHIEPGDGQLEALNDVELPGGTARVKPRWCFLPAITK